MSWRDEAEPLIDEEESTKGYIKGELMNYYLYLHKWHVLNNEINSLSCSTGGSIIQMPSGVSDGKSPQERMAIKSSDLEEMQEMYEQKMDRVDRWISVLTEKYYAIATEYIMKNQCRNAKAVGDDLKMEENTVKKYAGRAISQILSRNSNIL